MPHVNAGARTLTLARPPAPVPRSGCRLLGAVAHRELDPTRHRRARPPEGRGRDRDVVEVEIALDERNRFHLRDDRLAAEVEVRERTAWGGRVVEVEREIAHDHIAGAGMLKPRLESLPLIVMAGKLRQRVAVGGEVGRALHALAVDGIAEAARIGEVPGEPVAVP